jgi:hypothetical protein
MSCMMKNKGIWGSCQSWEISRSFRHQYSFVVLNLVDDDSADDERHRPNKISLILLHLPHEVAFPLQRNASERLKTSD